MTRTLAVVIIIFVAALGIAIVYALLSPSARFHDSTPVAVVGGETLTRGQVQQALWRGSGALALRTLVDQRIVEQLAQEKGLKPEPSRIEYLMGQEELRAGGARQLDERLAKAGRTRADLEKDLAQQALAELLM